MKDERKEQQPKIRVDIGGSHVQPFAPLNRKMRRAMKYNHPFLADDYNQAPDLRQRIRREEG